MVTVRPLMFVVKSKGMHQFVYDESRSWVQNAFVIETNCLSPANPPNVTPATLYLKKILVDILELRTYNIHSYIPFSSLFDPNVVPLSCSWDKSDTGKVVISRHRDSNYFSLSGCCSRIEKMRHLTLCISRNNDNTYPTVVWC